MLRFWLINILLLGLYAWMLTEETPVAVQVSQGQCQAIVPGRSITIDCPNLEGGSVGLFVGEPQLVTINNFAPLDLLAVRSAWAQAELLDADGHVIWSDFLRPIGEHGTVVHGGRISGDVALSADLYRSEQAVGLLLREANAEDGWLFLVSGRNRNGIWWRWQDGQPAEALIGIPVQKPFLAQLQSFLRRPLAAHQAALLLLVLAWLLSRVLRIAYSVSRITHHASRITYHASPNTQYAIRNTQYVLVCLTLLTFLTTTWVAVDVLEHIPHVQDSLTYLFQAETLAGGRIWADPPPLPDFFEQEFLLVQDGRWFGKYPPGFPAVLAIGVWLDAPWLINPLLATLTIPLLYALGRHLYNRPVGLLAAGLGALSPFFLFMSGSHMAHSAELFWITLFMLSWLRAVRRGSWHWPVAAGVALGMAFLTRQLAAIGVCIPFAVVVWLAEVKKTPKGVTTNLKRYQEAAIGPLLTGLACLPFVIALFAHQAALTGDPLLDPRSLFWQYDKVGFGPDVGEPSNIMRLVPAGDGGTVLAWFTDPSQPPRGHTPARGIYNVERLWRALEVDLYGWPAITTLAFIWLLFLLPHKNTVLSSPEFPRVPAPAAGASSPLQSSSPLLNSDIALLATFTVLLLAYAAYWHPGIMYGPRYLYAALPALLLLTARGIQITGRWLGGRPGQAAVGVVIGLLVLGNVLFNLPGQVAAHRGYNHMSGRPLALVEAAAPNNSLVFVDPGEDWWDYGAYFAGNTPWLDGRVIYARDLGDAENRRLMALFPERPAFRWQGNQLVPLNE